MPGPFDALTAHINNTQGTAGGFGDKSSPPPSANPWENVSREVSNGTFQDRGTGWDTRLDNDVGKADTEVKRLTAQRELGDTGFDPAALDAASAKRKQLNVDRWKTAAFSASNPALASIRQLISSGQLSYEDLGDLDITAINDPDALVSSVSALMKAKAAPPAAGPSDQSGEDPADVAKNNAKASIDAGLAQMEQGSKAIMDQALGQFDKSVGEAGTGIESGSNRLAESLGGAAAGAAAADSGAGLQANGMAQREVVKGKAKTDIQHFIDSHLSDAVGQEAELATMDAAHKTDLVRQGLDSLRTEITSAVDMSDTAAAGQVQALDAAIAEWNAAIEAGAEGTREHNKILGIVGGLLMAGAAAGGIALTGGAAAPFLAPVVGAGAATAVGAATR